MIDVKQENKEPPKTPPAATDAGCAAALPAGTHLIPRDQCLTLKSEEMSKGEKAFNWWVYKGMNYWLNLGMSLVITDFFMHGRGKNAFHNGVKKLTKGMTSTKMLNEEWAEWLSRIALGTFSLNSGGNILVVPLKILEDNKRKVVHWINKSIYKDPQIAPDGHAETPEEIHIVEEQLPQSWGHIIWRRVQGFATTTAVGMSLDATFKKKLDVPEMKNGKEVVYTYGQDRMAQGIVDAMKNLPFGEKLLSYDWVRRYAFYASLDSAYTWITSTIMEKTKGAKHIKMPKEIDDSEDPKGVEVRPNEITVLPEPGKKPASFAGREFSRKSEKLAVPAAHAQKLASQAAETDYQMAP